MIKSSENFFEKNSGIIGLILSFVSIVVSIIAICINPNSFVIAVSIASCQILVFITSLICIGIIRKSQKQIDKINHAKTTIENQAMESEKNNKELLMNEEELIRKILVFNKIVNKRFNSYLVDACDISDRFFVASSETDETIEKITEITKEQREEMYARQVKIAKDIYSQDAYKLYDAYISSTFSDLVDIIEKYLNNKGYRLSVSLSLKLLDRKCDSSININDVSVFTAFRDKSASEQGIREVGEKIFKINANSDFLNCMKKESYFRNNIPKDCPDYMNENDNYSLYYNCVATVPIICDYKNEKVIYGFLCCDTLNEEYVGQEIMDKNITNILFTASLTMGSLFDTIDTNWAYIMEDDVEFLSYIYSKRRRPE